MKRTPIVLGAAALLSALILSAAPAFAQNNNNGAKKPATGKDIAFDRRKGNCLACHAFPGVADDQQPGNSGPPLIAMKDRFPDKKVLRAKVWDATATNKDSYMPPMGKHKIMSEKEIDMVVDFIYGL